MSRTRDLGPSRNTTKRVPLRKQMKLFQRMRDERIAALLAGGHVRHAQEVPADAIPAAMELQAPANTYSPKLFYVDRPFCCTDCRKQEVWTAEDQLFWYEKLRGTSHTIPKRCRTCREVERTKKALHRERSLIGAVKKKAKKVRQSVTANRGSS